MMTIDWFASSSLLFVLGTLFFTFSVLFLWRGLSTDRPPLLRLFVITFRMACLALGFFGYNQVTEAPRPAQATADLPDAHVVQDASLERSGVEIYSDLFGMTPYVCREILGASDSIGKPGASTWLHVRTCPEEIEYLLTSRDFEYEEYTPPPVDPSDPLRPYQAGALGTTVHRYRWNDPDSMDYYFVYVNLATTELIVEAVEWERS